MITKLAAAARRVPPGGDGAGISGCVPGIVHAIAITVRRSCLGATGRLPADARTPLKRERKLVQADPHLDADAARLQRLAAFAGAPRRTLPGPGHRLAVRTGQRYRPRSRRWRCGHHGGRPVGALAGSSPGGAQGHPGPDGRQRRRRCRIRSGTAHRRPLRCGVQKQPAKRRAPPSPPRSNEDARKLGLTSTSGSAAAIAWTARDDPPPCAQGVFRREERR